MHDNNGLSHVDPLSLDHIAINPYGDMVGIRIGLMLSAWITDALG